MHTRAERSILQTVDHPFIVRRYCAPPAMTRPAMQVKLRYAFQTRDKLYLVSGGARGDGQQPRHAAVR